MLLYSSGNLIDILYCMKPCLGCQDGFSASPLTKAHAASSINVWYFAGRFSWQRHPEKDANDIQRGMKAVLENWCDLGVLIKGKRKPQPQLPIAQAAKQEKELLMGTAVLTAILMV